MAPKYQVGDKLEQEGLRIPELASAFPNGPPVCVVQEVRDYGGPEPYYVVSSYQGTATLRESQLVPWQGDEDDVAYQVEVRKRHDDIRREVNEAYDHAAEDQ